MPMRSHEDICVFYKNPPIYNPQMTEGKKCHSKGNSVGKIQEVSNYGSFTAVQTEGNLKYPKSIITYQKPHPATTVHPTQKPVELLEWLIKTYTNEGDCVLDNCMGSGTTAIAAIRTNRNFIGFELQREYFDIANKRIREEQMQYKLF
jgi:site-specific DNA-methyltransferase (adenine-specific)